MPRALIADTIDMIAVLTGRGGQRRLAGIWQVGDLSPAGAYVVEPLRLGPDDEVSSLNSIKGRIP